MAAFNAGIDAWKSQGAIAYFGQDEKISGEAAGKRLAADGAKKIVCVIQDQGNVALESRCAGVTSGLGGGQVENLNVNGTDMPSVESTITAKLQQDPSIDTVMTLGAPIAIGGCAVGEDRGQQGQDSDVRYQRGARGRHQERPSSVGRRPTAVSSGLPRHRLAVAVLEQPQHDRWRTCPR